jgi:hypothetical protein
MEQLENLKTGGVIMGTDMALLMANFIELVCYALQPQTSLNNSS